MLKLFFLTGLISTQIFLTPSLGMASTNSTKASSVQSLQQEAQKKYDAKEYDATRQSLEEALKIQPDNPHVQLNLALVAVKQKQIGLAFGLGRQLVRNHPNHSEALQLLRFLEKNHSPTGVSRQTPMLEQFHTHFLRSVSLDILLAMSGLVFAFAGWIWINHFKLVKKRESEELAPPSWPVIPSFLTLIFLILAPLTALKAWDQNIHRTTVIAKEAPLLSTPDEGGVELQRISEGYEVQVLEMNEKYVKVHLPGSSSGWVKSENLFK